MRTVSLTACVLVLLAGAAVLAPTASAQSVPLPKSPPPKGNDPIADILRPPGSVPNIPAAPQASSAQRASPAAPPADSRSAAGTARPGEATAFDAKQRALVDRVSSYLTTVQTLVG